MTPVVWFLVVLFLAAGILTAYAGWRGAPFAPTPQRAVETGLKLAEVGPADVVVDIGAGDGRVVVAAARRGARAVGYELSPFLWAVARLRLARARSRAQMRFADGFRADPAEATVFFLFLTRRAMPRAARVLARARPGTRVVTYAFPFPDSRQRRAVKLPGCATLYLYTTPLSST